MIYIPCYSRSDKIPAFAGMTHRCWPRQYCHPCESRDLVVGVEDDKIPAFAGMAT